VTLPQVVLDDLRFALSALYEKKFKKCIFLSKMVEMQIPSKSASQELSNEWSCQ
jgi:hypothetical protein